MPAVPSISQVRPGVLVSIVLKADQRTGRQVQGSVQDVLTRGNHPRGIKVRLADGRVGRVQGVVSSSASFASASASAHANANANLNATGTMAAEMTDEQKSEVQRDLAIQARVRGPDRERRMPYKSHRLAGRYTDVRLEDGAGEEPPAEMDLMAFVKTAKPRKGKRGGGGKGVDDAGEMQEQGFVEGGAGSGSGAGSGGEAATTSETTGTTVTVRCPVCGVFEGDEVAVAHHVETHFT